jgi:hypothetical protein
MGTSINIMDVTPMGMFHIKIQSSCLCGQTDRLTSEMTRLKTCPRRLGDFYDSTRKKEPVLDERNDNNSIHSIEQNVGCIHASLLGSNARKSNINMISVKEILRTIR